MAADTASAFSHLSAIRDCGYSVGRFTVGELEFAAAAGVVLDA
jgi:hypothetical protein